LYLFMPSVSSAAEFDELGPKLNIAEPNSTELKGPVWFDWAVYVIL